MTARREIVTGRFLDGPEDKRIWREYRYTMVCEGEPVAKLETAGELAIRQAREMLGERKC